MLCAHFLRTYAARYHRGPRELPRELRDALQRYDWPGNVRELENAVRRFVILGDVEASLADLRISPKKEVAIPLPGASRERDESRGTDGVSLRRVSAQAAEEAERALLGRVLAETRWNRKKAASQLQISYKALLNKLKKWDHSTGCRSSAARRPSSRRS